MASFTPGPWKVVEGNFGSGEFAWVEAEIEDAPVICGVFTRVRGEISDEDRANVYLIAAAPELYGACEAFRQYLDQLVDSDRDRLERDYGPPPVQLLTSALAKAYGESKE